MNNENNSDSLCYGQAVNDSARSVLTLLSYDALGREILINDTSGIPILYQETKNNKEWVLNSDLMAIEQDLNCGETIAEAFNKQGYETRKNVLDVYITYLSPWLEEAFCISAKIAKATTTEIIFKKQDRVFTYGLITEVFSPFYKKAELTDHDQNQINYSVHILRQLNFSDEEIWALIDW